MCTVEEVRQLARSSSFLYLRLFCLKNARTFSIMICDFHLRNSNGYATISSSAPEEHDVYSLPLLKLCAPAERRCTFNCSITSPFIGLTLLCLKNETRDQVEADLRQLMEARDVDNSEIERRRALLQLYTNGEAREPIEYTSYSMKRRR